MYVNILVIIILNITLRSFVNMFYVKNKFLMFALNVNIIWNNNFDNMDNIYKCRGFFVCKLMHVHIYMYLVFRKVWKKKLNWSYIKRSIWQSVMSEILFVMTSWAYVSWLRPFLKFTAIFYKIFVSSTTKQTIVHSCIYWLDPLYILFVSLWSLPV